MFVVMKAYDKSLTFHIAIQHKYKRTELAGYIIFHQLSDSGVRTWLRPFGVHRNRRILQMTALWNSIPAVWRTSSLIFPLFLFWLNQLRVCNFLYILLQLNIGSTVGQHLSFVASSYVHNRWILILYSCKRTVECNRSNLFVVMKSYVQSTSFHIAILTMGIHLHSFA